MFQRLDLPPLDLKDLWKGDLFKRDAFAATLCSLLKNTSHSSVIGINAPYGFGKTFFLLRLREQIKSEGGWVVYVNAWEYDYIDNVLFALLDALKAAAGELGDQKAVTKALKELGRAAVPAIAKAAGKKLLERAVGAEGTKDVLDAVAEVSGKTAEVLVDRYLKNDTTNQTLNALREEIRKFVATHLNEKSAYKTLLVIVDELDRAKPSYAVRFLETIKHLFGLSQVIFVIGCDRAVLTSSAQHEYGTQLPTDGYMRRLFDYWIDLPAPNPKQYVVYCATKLNLLEDRIFAQRGGIGDDIDGYAEFLLQGRSAEDASLRFIEQSVAHAGVVLRLGAVDRQAGLIGWLQGLKQFAPQLYSLYVSNEKASTIYEGLRSYDPFIAAGDNLQAWIMIWISNRKEPLTADVLRKLIGEGQPLYTRILGIAHDRHFYLDDRESTAWRIDRRMRTVTLHI